MLHTKSNLNIKAFDVQILSVLQETFSILEALIACIFRVKWK